MLASSGVSLEDAELANGGEEDKQEAERAHATDAFDSGLLLSVEFILESSHAWGSFVLVIVFILRLRSVMPLVVSLSLAIVSSVMSWLLFSLLLFTELRLFGLFLKLELLSDLIHEVKVLEVSTTEIHGLLLSSDVVLLSNLRIHILELGLFSGQESIEQKEEEEAVESPPEGNVGVLFSLEELGDHSSHSEHAHGEGKH